MKLRTLVFAVVTTAASAQTAEKPIPQGLWLNKEEGFVVRLVSCGQGFCGVAAGAPENGKHDRQSVCGHNILKDFTWNVNADRWEGHMDPPDVNRSIDANITTDNQTYLIVHAHMLVMTKTMNFVPYTGQVTDDCRM